MNILLDEDSSPTVSSTNFETLATTLRSPSYEITTLQPAQTTEPTTEPYISPEITTISPETSSLLGKFDTSKSTDTTELAVLGTGSVTKSPFAGEISNVSNVQNKTFMLNTHNIH